jgi:hypothetical protein
LRFSPTAWSKLLYLRDRGPTEVGGFGITLPEDPFCIGDIRLIRQTCTAVTVQFDDAGVADFFDDQVDRGLRPEQFGRLWIHTHPADSAEPSGTDEDTFVRCFGQTDWSVMFILARGGATCARLRFNVGPGAALLIPVEVDFGVPFPASDQAAWDQEYQSHVTVEQAILPTCERSTREPEPVTPMRRPSDDLFDDFEFWETGFIDR